MNGVAFEGLRVGQAASLGGTAPGAGIPLFAAAPFKKRVAHGMLPAGLTSAGPGTARLGRTLQFRAPVFRAPVFRAPVFRAPVFRAPVRAGGPVTATLRATCAVAGEPVVIGEGPATVPAPTPPAPNT